MITQEMLTYIVRYLSQALAWVIVITYLGFWAKHLIKYYFLKDIEVEIKEQ